MYNVNNIQIMKTGNNIFFFFFLYCALDDWGQPIKVLGPSELSDHILMRPSKHKLTKVSSLRRKTVKQVTTKKARLKSPNEIT